MSIGDSIHTLFSVPSHSDLPFAGKQTFFIGLSFANTTEEGFSAQGWAIVNPVDPNADLYWLYDSGSTREIDTSWFLGTPPASFNIQVFGSMASSLPLTFLNFSGEITNNAALLTWSSTNEINNKGFNVQRSTDGINYENIGFVKGNGNITGRNDYTFTDLKLNTGNNYYRLQQVDNDGKFSFSGIINLKLGNGFSWQVTPILLPEMVGCNYSYLQVQQFPFRFFHQDGRLIQTINKGTMAAGTYSLPLSLGRAAKGTYFIKAITGNNVSSKTIVIP